MPSFFDLFGDKPLKSVFEDRSPVPGNSVDFIVFSHVIEHLYHPLMTVRECYCALKHGGPKLLTEIPAYRNEVILVVEKP